MTSPEDQDAERALLQLDALGEIAGSLVAGKEFREDAPVYLRMLQGVLLTSHAAVYLFDEAARSLEPIAVRGLSREPMDLDPEAMKKLRQSKGPLAAGSLELGGDSEDLVLALAQHGDLLGAVRLGRKFMGEPYSERDLELLQLIGRNTSLALSCQKMIASYREASLALKQKILEMETVRDVGREIARLRDVDTLCRDILERAVALIATRSGLLCLRDRESGRLLARAEVGFGELFDLACDAPLLRRLPKATDPICREASEAPPSLGAERSVLAAPIRGGGSMLGAILLVDKEGRVGVEEFGEDDSNLLAGLAAQAAVAIENARLHEDALIQERTNKELQLAAEIQRNLLPQAIPDLPGYELAALTFPCHTVGGDSYDFVELPDGRLLLIVADVSGKGIPAALLVFSLNATLRALQGRLSEGVELAKLVAAINDSIYAASIASRFITCFFGILDLERATVTSVNAGHNPPFLLGADGTLRREFTKGGLCLGMFEGARYEQEIAELMPGDVVASFSDGVTEAQASDHLEFGEERLLEVLRDCRGSRAEAMVVAVKERVDAFVGDAPQFDDLTVVILRRLQRD